MARLTRAEQQHRTRAAVLTAARAEFTEHGYTDAKIDRIAERADLTRGAVYSNFAGKRALYLAVLAADAEAARSAAQPPLKTPESTGEALGAFARVWLERLPLAGDTPASGHLQLRSLSGVVDTAPMRAALAELLRLEALLLALSLDARRPPVRVADLALTLLHGAAGLAENAPGAGDPFDVARAAEHLAYLPLTADEPAPHLAFTAPARETREIWTPPAGLRDEITGRPVDLRDDGVVVVLGAARLGAVREAPGEGTTFVVVTADPAETGRLVRLRITDLVACLRRVFAPTDLPRIRIVLDEEEAIVKAIGSAAVDDRTETAVRIHHGRITHRAEGHGAGHAASEVTREERDG
ncbi:MULTISPECIES: TetR family transcriptional regulator [unclassified Streptomyces]|uniref:TetR family transcriptional regulator n=1 Tax=unclassified Streptomyces TaxID=2593676 RepID=UPI000DD7FBE7|nr:MULTISPECIES: TetR family transcriptional regulator [unclassified Streptomyces]QZZ25975.1 TetR family transcriptional regulator [Streptomyces sp. ST1015]